MEKRKIAWITFNAFIDTDLYIVRELIPYYNIDWYIIKSGNDKYEYVDELSALKKDINIKKLQCGARLRSIECITFYVKLLRHIRDNDPDVIYTSLAGAPYFIPALKRYADKRKVALAIHNVHVPKGGSSYYFFKVYNKIAISSFNNYQVFSKDQYHLLSSIIPEKNICYAPFILKDYGPSDLVRSDKRITFLNFGNIREYKRIDVLITAAQNAYERTGKLFRVIIAGKCDDWEKYSAIIKYPELFELKIHRLENEEIPDLFAETDYFVAPYQDIAQSGSSVIAINYGKPIIASRLPAFEEYVEDRITGRLITPADADSLTDVIQEIVVSDNDGYEEMVEELQKKREELFSTDAIVKKYREFIDGIISGNKTSGPCDRG